MAKDLDFDQLYPNRFLKSGEFSGRDVTLTISGVSQEELEGSSGKKVKVIVSFRETKKEWVAPKTCGICLKAMFGRKVSGWVGKRVTLYPANVMAFGEMVQAIRVRGSPEISKVLDFEEQLGRAKVRFKVVPTGKQNGKPAPAAETPAPAQEQEEDAFDVPSDGGDLGPLPDGTMP